MRESHETKGHAKTTVRIMLLLDTSHALSTEGTPVSEPGEQSSGLAYLRALRERAED